MVSYRRQGGFSYAYYGNDGISWETIPFLLGGEYLVCTVSVSATRAVEYPLYIKPQF